MGTGIHWRASLQKIKIVPFQLLEFGESGDQGRVAKCPCFGTGSMTRILYPQEGLSFQFLGCEAESKVVFVSVCMCVCVF